MFNKSRRKSLRRKGRISCWSLHSGLLPLWGYGWAGVGDIKRLEHLPGSGGAGGNARAKFPVDPEAYLPDGL